MLGTIGASSISSASYGTLRDNVRGWYGAAVRIAPGIKAMLALIYRPDIFHRDFAITSICSSAQRGQIIFFPYLRAASIAVSFSAQALVSGNPPPAGCSDHGCPGRQAWWLDNQLVGDPRRA